MKQPWDGWFGAGRRLGIGLVIVLAMGLLQVALGGVARAQGVTTTTVQGTVYLAGGQVGAGTVNVSWPAFTTATGALIAAGHTMVTIAPDGYLSVNLAPNLGSMPAGLFYTAVYQMSDGTTSTQYWVVPAAAQASLAQVQSQLMPAAQAVQTVSKAYVDQQIAELTGSLLTASGGTLSGNLYLNGDPTVPLQAADKHYVDSTFSMELPISGGSMTGPLTLSGDPTVALQAADKNYVDAQVSTALPITGGAVTGELTAKQIGAVYEVDQFAGGDFGAKLQACLGSLSSSYGGTCDARNFAGTLAMGSNLTISTANAMVLLPCATVTTASQVIVTAGTRNVTLHGCALRGVSTASGSQGGTVFLYSGTSAMVQVGDPTYAADTSGFHIDDVVINTTAATSAGAQGLVAFRTQEMDVQGLYLMGNANQTGMTLDGTGNYTGGSFYGIQFVGFQTAVNAIGHQVANPATTDWMNASTFVRLHIDCATSGGNPIAGTYGINLQQGDGNTFTGGDVESCGTALHLGANAQNNTIVGLRNENSTNQVVADAGSSYNNWMTGGTMFTGKLTDNGTRNSFMDSFHRTFNGMNGDYYGSQQDATVVNHYRLGIGLGNERGLQNEIQTDYGYRWISGYSDATAGEQFYQVQDLLNNVYRLSIGQYNNGQSSTNNQTVMNAAGTGAVVFNGSNNAGTGGVVFGSGGATETTVATVDKSGNAQFNGTLQVAGVSTLLSTPTVKNQLDAEVDAVLWAGLTQSQKESLVYKDWNGNSQWYAEKDASNNWELISALGGLDSFKAYQSTNSGDTYVNAANSSGVVRVNYETGAGTAFKVYGGGSSPVYASFTGATSIAFPGLAASSGHNCVQIDNSGYITNTGSACGAGSGSVGTGNSGQIAYYTGTGTTIGGMSTVPVSAGGTGGATAAAAVANIVNGNAIAPSSVNSSGTIQGAAVSAPSLTGGMNGGLATTQNSLKQDARICTDINITTSAGTTTLTSSTGCANFTTADNSRISLLYPNNAVGVMALNTAGTSWAINDRFAIAGGTGGIGIVTAVSSGVPSAIAIENSGTGYSVSNGVAASAISPSTGTGLTVNITALGASGRMYTGGLTVVSSMTATLSSTYTGVNATGATMILGTDDGAAFNTMVSTQIAANSARGELTLGCKPIITTVTLLIAGGRGTQVAGCGLASGITKSLSAGNASGTTVIWAGAAHLVTLAVAGTVVTLTDPSGHGFTSTYCTRTGAECLVNVQGTTQPTLSGTFLIQNPTGITATTLTYNIATSGLIGDSGFMPFNDVMKVQNCYGCTVHDLNIMGSDQASTKPRALIDTNDLSVGPYPNSLNDFYNLYLGNLTGFGNLPGSAYLSDSTAMYAILADPAMTQDDRNQVRNVHVTNVDVCFGAEQSQPQDWTFSGTIGCYYSGAGFAMMDGNWWHISGTIEMLQNGVDFLLANGSHLDVAKFNEETDGPARVYAPSVGGPGDVAGGTSMLLEALSNPCCGMPGGTLSMDHGIYTPGANLPANGNGTGDMIWTNSGGADVRLSDFTVGQGGELSEPVVIPIVDFGTVTSNRSVFRCTGCSGLTAQNFKVPTPGSGSANHITVIENDAPNGPQNGAPSHGINVLAGNDSAALDNFRQDVAAKMRIMGGYLTVPQLSTPTNVNSLACTSSGSTTYYYKITAVSGGLESTPSLEYSVPSCASTVSGINSITGRFYPVVGADSYNVYRSTAAGGSGSEKLDQTIAANSYTGQITPNAGSPNSFTDTTPDGSLGAQVVPVTNATGKINAGGGYQVNGSPLATGNLSDWIDTGVQNGAVPVWSAGAGKWTPSVLPAAASTAGDVVCAVAADATIGSQAVTAVSSTATTMTYSVTNAGNYFAPGQKVQTQNNGTGGYNGGPWYVTSNTGSSVVVSSTNNPGAGTAGGTLSLYCGNQSLDGSLNYIPFNTTFTFPANTLGSSVLSVKARPQFGVFSSASAAQVNTFDWELGGTQVWKSSGLTVLVPGNSLTNGAGTYPLDLTFLPGYSSVTYTTVPPFTLGGVTPLTDTDGLTGTSLPPLAISTSSSQVLSLQLKYKPTGVASGTYTSGGTITGTTGQTCTLASFNDSSTATATVALTGTNTIASATALTITARGGGATAAPTTATLGSGTATCSGTATISTVLGGSSGNALLMYGLVLTP